MAKLADAADLKSADRKVVGVQFPLRAPENKRVKRKLPLENREAISVWWLF